MVAQVFLPEVKTAEPLITTSVTQDEAHSMVLPTILNCELIIASRSYTVATWRCRTIADWSMQKWLREALSTLCKLSSLRAMTFQTPSLQSYGRHLPEEDSYRAHAACQTSVHRVSIHSRARRDLYPAAVWTILSMIRLPPRIAHWNGSYHFGLVPRTDWGMSHISPLQWTLEESKAC